MRKRKSVKKGDESEGSEHGGEPEEFQDSGEDWTPDANPVSTICLELVVISDISPVGNATVCCLNPDFS